MSKRNKIAILLLAIAVLILFLLPLCKTGRCAVRDGHVLFLGDKGDVVTLSPVGPLVEKSYQLLDTGDKVLTIYFGVQESDPAQTTAWLCIPLWPGDLDDFSAEQLSELTYLGWLTP